MLTFILANGGTILVAALLLAVVFLIVCSIIKDRKRGKSSCGCGGGCGHCASSGICHGKGQNTK